MHSKKITPTGVARTFPEDQVIVSKTDVKGRVTYCNKLFCDVAGYTEAEVLGQPHSLVRHPDMPRCIFKFAWSRIEAGHEVFAYVKNLCKNGDHYWVFAHMTPSYDARGQIIGYHSSRRVPNPKVLAKIEPLYAELLAEEARHASRKDGMNAAYQIFLSKLSSLGLEYDEFIFSLAA